MTDLDQLTATGYAWHIGRGRAVANEPLYAVALFEVDGRGIANTDRHVFIVEGDDLHACVIRAVAWSEQHPSKQ